MCEHTCLHVCIFKHHEIVPYNISVLKFEARNNVFVNYKSFCSHVMQGEGVIVRRCGSYLKQDRLYAHPDGKRWESRELQLLDPVHLHSDLTGRCPLIPDCA